MEPHLYLCTAIVLVTCLFKLVYFVCRVQAGGSTSFAMENMSSNTTR